MQRPSDTGEFTASRGDHASAASDEAFGDRRSETTRRAHNKSARAIDRESGGGNHEESLGVPTPTSHLVRVPPRTTVAAMRRTVNDLVREAKARIEELSVGDLQSEIAAGSCTVIDIRDFRERLERGAIPGAVSAPRGMLEFWFDPESPYHRESFTFDKRYVLYCAGGQRSALAAAVLRDIGFDDVAHLEVGFNGWAEAGGAVEDVSADSKWVKRS